MDKERADQESKWSNERLKERGGDQRDGARLELLGKYRAFFSQIELGVVTSRTLRMIVEGGGPGFYQHLHSPDAKRRIFTKK